MTKFSSTLIQIFDSFLHNCIPKIFMGICQFLYKCHKNEGKNFEMMLSTLLQMASNKSFYVRMLSDIL